MHTTQQQCSSPTKKQCFNCKHGKQCFYKKTEHGDQCSVCLNTTNYYDCYVRCTTCSVLTCIPCDWNELRGLCPHCDLVELNEEHYCIYCKLNVRIGQYMIYDCDACEEEHQSCLDCCEHDIPCHQYKADDHDVITS